MDDVLTAIAVAGHEKVVVLGHKPEELVEHSDA
jgi:hypothetical protein